ncbi:MAG: hypothetical protein QOJ20_92 [Mycobacterium sp.]|nr:hypothetical protein [Mycobacterium sp.]MDT5278897.1 hypothetical protein [Mycobacterium sp.]
MIGAALCRRVPLAVGVQVGRDTAADAKNRVAGGVELHGPDRHVQFTTSDR